MRPAATSASAAALAAILLAPILVLAQKGDPDAGIGPNTVFLTADDVRGAITRAALAVDDPAMVIAVSDRQGNILGVFRKTKAPNLSTGNFSLQVDTSELAAAVARTAGFFSHSQAPLSSRTVRYISGNHFPPGISFVGPAALYGIENTNRGCPFNAEYIPGQEFPPARTIDGSKPGLGIITGKKDIFDSDPSAVIPGGIPFYKDGRMVGGIGVAGVSNAVAEYAALVAGGLTPIPELPFPGRVYVDGVELPFAEFVDRPAGTTAASGTLESLGEWVVLPKSSPGPAPEGYLVAPKTGAKGGLSKDDVTRIIENAIVTANQTRALIRLPAGTRAKFVISVADLDGQIIGSYRMKDSTIFSLDVSVAKARNVIFFSGPDRKEQDLPGVPMKTAVTNRTIEFGAQPLYPPGIDYGGAGPFFELYKFDVANPCTQGSQSSNPYQNGIIFFPGALPLYRNGVMVGGLGVSGDGIEQDDFVTVAGAAGFEAPKAIRADNVMVQGVRLPYTKFPRNPTQ